MTPSKLESLKSSIALSEARYHKVNEKVRLLHAFVSVGDEFSFKHQNTYLFSNL